MAAVLPKAFVRRGFAFMAGLSFAAIPTVGPFLAILALATGHLAIQRADVWWWFSGLLLSAPFLLTGHPLDAGLTFAQVIAVWLIYRSAIAFRNSLRSDEVTRDIGAGLVVGLAVTLALGLRHIGEFRFDVAITPLDAIVWNTHPALFGHAILVLSALLAIVVPSSRLRVVALALGAAGVIISGSREAVLAWLVIALGLRFVARRGTRGTRISEWILIGVMAVLVSGLSPLVGLGRMGFLTDFTAGAEEANLFRGTEVAAGDWWFPLGVSFRGEQVMVAGEERTAIAVAKNWSEPWSRLQQAVTLTPSETYTLSAAIRSPTGVAPGFDGWGRESSDAVPVNLAATLEGDTLRTTSTGALTVLSSSMMSIDDVWQRLFVTFRYDGESPLTWYVGVVPDRSNETGTTTRFAELQLTASYSLLPYRPGTAERGVTDLRTSRFPIWRDALEAISARPLLGWGPNGFPLAVSTLHPDETLLRPVAAHAHNSILTAWVERGVVGVIGLVGLLAMLALRAIQQRDRAVAVVVAGVIVLNLFDATLLSAGVIYPLAAVFGWRAVGHRQTASHETGVGSALFTRLSLAASDYVIALLAFGATYLIFRPGGLPAVQELNGELILYLACLWPLLNAAVGQYPGYGRPSWQELQWSVLASIGAGMLAILLGAVFGSVIELPLRFLGLATIVSTIAAPIGRALTKVVLSRLRVWGRPVVLVGDSGSADQFAVMLLNQPQLGLRPVALVDEHAVENPAIPGDILRPTTVTSEVANSANHVILAPGSRPNATSREILSAAGRDAFRVVQVVPDLHFVPSTDVVARPLGRALSLEVRNNLAFGHNRFIKRAFDLTVVTIGSVFALPLVGAIALAIRLDSPGPAFFRQRRIGRDGKAFYVWKFRSMVQDAQERLQKLLATNPDAAREWAETQKLVNDPRVTRVGSLLRKTSLDELPQLWNVVRGEMSLVGPRPIVEDEIEKYQDDYRYYTQVRPGMTGAWQVSGRSDTSYEFRVELDTYYVRNWNLWIDLDILVKTVGVVLKREGAY